MNRSFVSVIAEVLDRKLPSLQMRNKENTETSAEEVAEMLKNSKSVIITPDTAWQLLKPNIPFMKSQKSYVQKVLMLDSEFIRWLADSPGI